MSAMSRLTVMNRADVEATRKQLRKGLLKSEVRKPIASAPAGHQPAGSGLHFSHGKSILVQFPAEIQCLILRLLEPIWLFQVEKAYPEVARLLASPQGNKIWYDSIPRALFTEPEYFQSEIQVAKRVAVSGRINHRLEQERRRGRALILPPHEFQYDEINIRHVHLPALTGLSDLAILLDADFKHLGIHHPANSTHYPVIGSCSPRRLRTLALGGPFNAVIDYRRELAGHLHYNKRCYICLELVTGPSDLRPHQRAWGMTWCAACLGAWTLTPAQMHGVPGLRELVGNYDDSQDVGQGWISRQRDLILHQWRPFVDGVLRNEIGMDFAAAEAKEKYLIQVLEAWTWSRLPLADARRKLRQEIVSAAQGIWEAWAAAKYPGVMACSAFVDTANLSAFLFPARLTDESKTFHPYDFDEEYPTDPVLALKSSREIRSRTTAWKAAQAVSMLTQMLPTRHTSHLDTPWTRAADRFHVGRIKETLSADDVILQLNNISPPPLDPYKHNLGDQPQLYHLDVMLTKLHIYRANYPHYPPLPEKILKLVKEAYFKKLALEACIACPHNGGLTLNRGVEGVVAHCRQVHGKRYWASNDWSIFR